MALSLFNFLIIAGLHLFPFIEAATVTKDFNITWAYGNPDGAFNRSVIGINNQWPIPKIEVNKGDRVVINVFNGLGNVSTALHFHGIFLRGQTEMDGAAGVTQCSIPPGSSFTYNFTVDQPGTYWYHSHVKAQYPEGLRGPFIVHDPDMPFKDQYDEEIVLPLSDWYHQMVSTTLMSRFISFANPTGAEPVPDAALMNDTQNLQIHVQPGKTYMFRIINMAAFAAQYFWIEGHTMRVVEVDGVYTEPAEASMLYLTAAQRYSVLVTAKNETGANFAIQGSMDQDLFDAVPDGLNPNVTGWLVYDGAKELPKAQPLDAFEPFDDFGLVPQDGEKLLDKADYTVTLDLKMDNLGDGANYAFFNDITYVVPKVPTIYTALTTGDLATNPAVYGVNTNAFILKKDDIVDIVVNNNDPGKHPFHLHGHNFQVVSRSADEAGPFVANASIEAAFPSVPMRRDTILVRPNGNFVLRFRADNPGIWLFHCHIEWHTASGLIATMIESPLELQSSLTIPEDHYAACRAAKQPFKGNAAGNEKDFLDLKGANVSPKPLPAGFTARGIVALVFSIISAFLGMAAIAWYGAQPLGKGTEMAARGIVAEAGEGVGEGEVTGTRPVGKLE
ncbi:iron transport multicopper oxidase FET3 [Trichodelitschia bisporula]|uniref:Iron transport multicopper oxidase FET3 n=1 Tax=Trichodelitschia bisporula TaxID=703511 RepID=A0A6G1HKC6_9PEZI|nr:iron transport multicopper oxidase FET3 [Trichodelitschia bisporula]